MSPASQFLVESYNLIAVGRPIIVAAEGYSEAALMLKEEDIGWVVRPEDPLDLAEAISIGRIRSGGDTCKRSTCGSRCSTL